MFLAYVDDSGDTGPSGSKTYTLACVLVASDGWPRVFDDLIDFRRMLKKNFGVLINAELKANFLLRNKGIFYRLGLTEDTRRRIYTLCMRVQANIGTKTFAIIINKEKLEAKDQGRDPREVAWEYLIQRLERLSTKSTTPVMIFHDEGEAATIRKIARKARRAGRAGSAFGTGSLSRPAKFLIDDPVARDSGHSYFVQMADLNAYAAFRRVFQPPQRLVQIVPQNMWDQIGTGIYRPANKLKGGIPGIVVWPR
ncbi:MAG TPA: DUF3800 domain-containing protein [Gaiellaceae bacterium]